jgi:CHAT domain-containing protein
LPESRPEAEQIAELFGVRAWLGRDADKSSLAAHRSPRILHLATHAFALRDPTSESVPPAHSTSEPAKPAVWKNLLRRVGLALAGANRDTEDGRLTAWDASGYDLTRTAAVVLPECLNATVTGAALNAVGLQRSFVVSGARAVVTSLWPVPDGPRRELLAVFFRLLLEGRSSAEALREAQRSVRAKHPDPAVWGALISHGIQQKDKQS